MLDVTTCIEDIIGLSELDCPCFGTDEPILGDLGTGDVLGGLSSGGETGLSIDRPADYNKSKSGLFLDDQKYSVPLKFTASTKDCGEGNVWDVLARARKNGIRNFITDLAGGIRTSYSQRLRKFRGNTAGVDHNYTLPGLSTLAGVYISPEQYRGAKGIINEVELYVQGTAQYEVNFYSEDDLTNPVNTAPIVVDVTANFGKTKLTEPLALSFSDIYGRKVGYYAIYTLNGAEPRNIRFGCNCGNDKPWEDHFFLYGVTADTLAELPSVGRNTEYPNGMRLNVEVRCGMDWLCRTWDFASDWDRVASEAMVLYGICDLLERQLNDPQPVATAQPELVLQKLTANRALLDQRMPWLAGNIPLEETDCYVCKQLYEVQEMQV